MSCSLSPCPLTWEPSLVTNPHEALAATSPEFSSPQEPDNHNQTFGQMGAGHALPNLRLLQRFPRSLSPHSAPCPQASLHDPFDRPWPPPNLLRRWNCASFLLASLVVGERHKATLLSPRQANRLLSTLVAIPVGP